MIHELRRPGNLAYSAQAPLRLMGVLENFATTDHYTTHDSMALPLNLFQHGNFKAVFPHPLTTWPGPWNLVRYTKEPGCALRTSSCIADEEVVPLWLEG
jgi:hypothetical protein